MGKQSVNMNGPNNCKFSALFTYLNESYKILFIATGCSLHLISMLIVEKYGFKYNLKKIIIQYQIEKNFDSKKALADYHRHSSDMIL